MHIKVCICSVSVNGYRLFLLSNPVYEGLQKCHLLLCMATKRSVSLSECVYV